LIFAGWVISMNMQRSACARRAPASLADAEWPEPHQSGVSPASFGMRHHDGTLVGCETLGASNSVQLVRLLRDSRGFGTR
jgi:hypothetical protein